MPFYTPSNEMEAMTVRPPATSIFGIDSDDRYNSFAERRTNPTYPFSFNIQKNEAFLNGFFKRIALTEFRMNWTLPNISRAWGNSQIQMFVNVSGTPAPGNPYTLTLEDGFYGAEELASELQRVMRTVPNMNQASVTMGNGGTDTTPDEWFYFRSGIPTVQFYFNPIPSNPYRQLIDMLNINQPTGSTYSSFFYGGIPTLRATDYVDIVCSQLTQHQNLRDASTSSTNRDILARIYLDESTPSRSTTVTNNYSGTVGNVTSIAQITGAVASGNIVTYTLNTSAGTFPVGSYVVISGITPAGATSFNGSGRLLLTTTASPFTATVELPYIPTGTPGFSASSQITFYDKIESVSIPQSSWDDNVNGVTPFVLYRQFITPKQVRWSGRMPIGNLRFELYDDMGRSIQDLWSIYPPSSAEGFNFANSFSWNSTLLLSED